VDLREQLPIFAPSADDVARASQGLIRVDGLVARPLALTRADLDRLEREVLDEPFVCEEGWSVPGLRWRGIRLSQVLALAQPLPAARYVRAGSGAWVVPLALSDADGGLVCDELNGEPLTLEHGAPWRLVVSGAACYTNVKWLDHLELVAEAGEDNARRIAQERARR
jgi:DMSO/TMAO reductase YedYZ molybdopterin-dependent catalytic subunit